MDFRNLKTLFLQFTCLGVMLAAVGCTVGPGDDTSGDYNIGNPLQSISALSAPDGSEAQSVVLFDKMLRRIHQFDLANMQATRSFAVRNPGEEHFVLTGKNGNYIIDLSLKGISIFNKYNQATHQPLRFQGKPKASYFNADSGIFVLYDDLQTVGLMRLDGNGEVLGAKPLGASVLPGSSATMAAGDVDASGTMIVSLTNGRIVLIDTLATISGSGVNAVGWHVNKDFATALTDIKWLAPLPLTAPGAHQLILTRSSDKISVIDTVTETEVSSYTIDGTVEKLSKYVDPHVVIRKNSSITVVFSRGGVIETKTFVLTPGPREIKSILSSTLNLAKDTWSFVDTPNRLRSIFNDLDEAHEDRQFRRYILSQALPTHNLAIDNDPQIEISENFIFSLFKDELGYAERINVNTEEKKTVERFNLRYIPAN